MTTTLPQSGSDTATSFTRLHPEIQRWIWEQKWPSLRPVQDEAIRQLLSSRQDVLISAATAAGKTEAAFFPALTLAVANAANSGLSILCVSPLKALINDQFRRLESLCERLSMNLVRWHGDVPQGPKQGLLEKPSGVVLITPESIEALFLRRTTDAERMFENLQFVVIDELHAFLHGARGLHVYSLLRRIDAMAKQRPRRIGLSATLGDLSKAAEWLRQSGPEEVAIVNPASGSPETKLQVRAYLRPAREKHRPRAKAEAVDEQPGDEKSGDDAGRKESLDQIADHLFKMLRGDNNLVFAGSRGRVEALSDLLREKSEEAKVPNEFFPHHGSLAKPLREELESRLKANAVPTTAIATSTLELGIDIGSVKSVAQLNGPRSMSSLRQRLGRSGRRAGSAAVLRIYAEEPIIVADSDILERLHFDVVRAVAAVRLLIEKFVEPPEPDPALATVALHQVLSMIVQQGGARIESLFESICHGPFGAMDRNYFVMLLRGMIAARLIEQSEDRTLMVGELGEKLTARHDFFAVFQTDQEWRIVAEGKTLGTIPIINAVAVGGIILFAGQRWRIKAVDDIAYVLEVVRHRSAKVPVFYGGPEPVHDRLVAEMLAVYGNRDIPAYVDATARQCLMAAREAFVEAGISQRRLVPSTVRDTHILTWRGTRMNSVLEVALIAAGATVELNGVGLTLIDTDLETTAGLLDQLAKAPPSATNLSEFVLNLRSGKYDEYVPDDVLRSLWVEANEHHVDELGALASDLVRHSLL